MAQRVPEMYFWPAKTRKNLELFEMHACHWHGAQIWLRYNWRKLVTVSLSLLCIDGYKCLRYWNEFFSAAFQVLDWSFLVLHFDGNVCNWIPKVIWTLMDWFWGFMLENGFSRWLHICMDWNLQEFLNCYSILTTSNFFGVYFEGYSGLFFKNACIFNHSIS